MPASKRIQLVDIVKGICIILVVVAHYIPEGSPRWYISFVHFISLFRMPLFMSLSGFLFYEGFKKRPSYEALIKNKFDRLMVPYLSLSYLFITIKLFAQQFIQLENPVSWRSYIRALYLPEAAYLLWFLYALFLLFLVVPLFIKYIKHGLYLFALISIFTFYISIYLPDYFCLFEVGRMSIFFACGCFIGKYLHSKVNSILLFIVLIVIQVICIILGKNDFTGSIFPTEGTTFRVNTLTLIVALATCACLYLSLSVSIGKVFSGKLSDFLIAIGTRSSAIYLFHTMCMGPFKYVWINYIGINTHISFTLSAVFIPLIGILVPCLIKEIINKNSSLSRLFLGEFSKA